MGNHIVDQEVAIFLLTYSKDVKHLLYTSIAVGIGVIDKIFVHMYFLFKLFY